MQNTYKENEGDGALMFLSIFLTIIFGLFFIPTLLKEGPPSDFVEWWFTTVWAVGAIFLGSWATIFTNNFVGANRRVSKFLYKRTHFFLFKLLIGEMEKFHIYISYKIFGILFITIGAVMLFQNLNPLIRGF